MRKSLLAAAGILLGALLAEVGLRLFGFSYVIFERPDLVRGVSLAPGRSGWQTLEGRSYVTINSHGYRDRERNPTKPQGVYRIAVLGDSFTEARHVALEDTFCAVLERLLNTHSPFGGKSVEVLNFGVSGYSTAQELLTLREDVYEFGPDYVLLAVFPANDVSDNSRALSDPTRTIPYFTLQGDELVLDSSFLESPAFKDRYSWRGRLFFATQEHSRLVQLVYRTRGDVSQFLRDGWVDATPSSEPGLASRVYREPADAEWEQAWRVTERLIEEMFDDVRSRGIAFGVVTVSAPAQSEPDLSLRRRFLEELQVDDFFYPDRRIRALGEKTGFPVLNLAHDFQRYVDEHQVALHGFANTRLGWGHWNEDGHRLAATLMAGWLSGRATWDESGHARTGNRAKVR